MKKVFIICIITLVLAFSSVTSYGATTGAPLIDCYGLPLTIWIGLINRRLQYGRHYCVISYHRNCILHFINWILENQLEVLQWHIETTTGTTTTI